MAENVERLSFSFQLHSVTVKAPTKLLSHHALYVKWTRGKTKGKFHPVPCNSNIANKNGCMLLCVDLPMTHQVTFDVNMHTDSQGTLEKKTLELQLLLLRYTDHRHADVKSRNVVGTATIDLRELMQNVQVGKCTRAQLLLSDREHFDAEYIVSPVGASGAVIPTREDAMRNRASVEQSVTKMCSNGSLASSVQRQQWVPLVCNNPEEYFSVAEDVLGRAALAARFGDSFSTVSTIVEEGQFKAISCDLSLEEVFQCVASSEQGRFGELLHAARGDTHYSDPPWTIDTQHSAFKVISYDMRLAKDRFVAATEKCIVCFVGSDIFVHVSNGAPTAPLVGDSVRLELLFHFSGQQQGTIVAMYGYAHIASSKVKFMFGARIENFVEKLLILAEHSILQLVQPMRLGKSARLTRTKFRTTMPRSAALLASLDPNLWRRLTDQNTLPHADLVLQYLLRLQSCSVTRVSELQVQSLESIAVYHRRDEQVVQAVCNLLVMLCRAAGPIVVASCSPTLATSLKSVFAMHKTSALSTFESFLSQVESAIQQRNVARRKDLSAERNFWHVLEKNMGNKEIVEQAVEKIAQGRGVILNLEHMSLLAAVLSLHLQSRVVTNCTFAILSRVPANVDKVTPQLTAALEAAFRFDPSLHVEHRSFMDALQERKKTFSEFDVHFSAAIGEPVVFECLILLESPRWAATKCYVTKTHLCVGNEVVPLEDVKRIERHRSLLRPAIKIVLGANHDDYFLVVLSREELLKCIAKVGYARLICDDHQV